MGGCSGASLWDEMEVLAEVFFFIFLTWALKKDSRTVPLLHKSPGEDPHEAGQTHQLHAKLLQHAVNSGVKLSPTSVQLVIHHLGFQLDTTPLTEEKFLITSSCPF